MRLIQIIGEAASKISPEFADSHPEIPWRSIVGMRHRLVHDYSGILIDADIPMLIPAIEPLVSPDEERP